MNASKISILFLLSKSRPNAKGECAIRCRITFQKERKEFATGFFIEAKNWNAKKQKAIGKNADNINSNLGLIKQKLEQVGLEYGHIFIVQSECSNLFVRFVYLLFHLSIL